MERIIYCIPSRGRPETINKDTLRFIPESEYKNTYVFVNPAEQIDEYIKYGHKDIQYVAVPFTGNIAKVKNYILDSFPEGEKICILDDDITRVINHKRKKFFNIKPIIENTFKFIDKLKLKLFGFEPAGKCLNCTNQISLFGFAIQVVGIVNNKKLRYDETYKTKEDIYLSCLAKEQNGGVLIDYRYTFSAKARTNAGGCQEYRNKQMEIQNKTKLLERFPLMIKQHPKREEDVVKIPTKGFNMK